LEVVFFLQYQDGGDLLEENNRVA